MSQVDIHLYGIKCVLLTFSVYKTLVLPFGEGQFRHWDWGTRISVRNRKCDNRLGCFVHFFPPSITGPLTVGPPIPTLEPSAKNTKAAWG
jgi:hypothetical protein